ncbi:MAG: bifunctional metallophosphatase/5'-nucleotidase [Ignavibacteria bacterium]|nr:bifunctional metallophosphatase/5'-nucleotidase [Ignavibacteria bacterium]
MFNSLLASEKNLTILFVNDSHSHLSAMAPREDNLNGKVGGAPRLVSVVNQVKAAEQNVLFLHAGDYSIGDLFYNTTFGVAELRVLQMLGLDALTLGNHEFDLTPLVLQTAFDSAFVLRAFPVLCANAVLTNSSIDGLKKYIKPYTIKDFDGVKVGIFGLTTPSTNLLSNPSPIFIDTNIFQIAGQYVDSLITYGCDIVICLSHLGVNLDIYLATMVPGIDFIIGGHDHLPLSSPLEITNQIGKKTYIVQTKGFYSQLGKLSVSYNTQTKSISINDYQLIELDENVPEATEVKQEIGYLITEIENRYGKVYSQLIGNALDFFDEVTDLKSDGPYDTDVGNLVTDAFRAKTGTDIAIEANGSTARPIYPGPIVPADLFRTVGYGFNLVNGLGYRIVKFEITGLNLLKGLETALGMVDPTLRFQDDEFYIQVSGMSYVVDLTKNPGNRIVAVRIGNEPLQLDKTYSVTANEFLLQLLEYFDIPFSNSFIYEDYTEFQALVDYVINNQQIRPSPKGRITSPKQTSVDFEEAKISQPLDIAFDSDAQCLKLVVNAELKSPLIIDIFDLLGKNIKTFVLNNVSPGFYDLKLAKNYIGWIITRVRTQKYLIQKPMLIIR